LRPTNKDQRRFISVTLLALVLFSIGTNAQTPALDTKQAIETKPADPKTRVEHVETIFLKNVGQQNDFNDAQTALRNVLPRSAIYGVPTQNAIVLRGTEEEIQLAKKVIADIDLPHRTYRLIYTITEVDGGKRGASQHFSMVVATGAKTVFKQGTKIPLVTGSTEAASTSTNTQFQYIDVGVSIEARLEGSADGLHVATKVEQSSLAQEKTIAGVQEPVINQTVLEATSPAIPGKPVVLGSLDIPGTARHQEIELTSELVR
jgi:type II secretory pathway component GspD/PulD (secretin)